MLVEDEVRNRKGPESVPHGLGLELEALSAAGFGGEEGGKEDYRHQELLAR